MTAKPMDCEDTANNPLLVLLHLERWSCIVLNIGTPWVLKQRHDAVKVFVYGYSPGHSIMMQGSFTEISAHSVDGSLKLLELCELDFDCDGGALS